MKSGERENNDDGRVKDATGIVDGSYFILPCPHATICCPHRELKQILPARRAIGYSTVPIDRLEDRLPVHGMSLTTELVAVMMEGDSSELRERNEAEFAVKYKVGGRGFTR